MNESDSLSANVQIKGSCILALSSSPFSRTYILQSSRIFSVQSYSMGMGSYNMGPARSDSRVLARLSDRLLLE